MSVTLCQISHSASHFSGSGEIYKSSIQLETDVGLHLVLSPVKVSKTNQCGGSNYWHCESNLTKRTKKIHCMSKRIKTTVHQNNSVERNDGMTSKKGSVILCI